MISEHFYKFKKLFVTPVSIDHVMGLSFAVTKFYTCHWFYFKRGISKKGISV